MTGGLPGLDAENAVYILRRHRGLAPTAGPRLPALPSDPQRPHTIQQPTRSNQLPLPPDLPPLSAIEKKNLWQRMIGRFKPAPDPKWWSEVETDWSKYEDEPQSFPDEHNNTVETPDAEEDGPRTVAHRQWWTGRTAVEPAIELPWIGDGNVGFINEATIQKSGVIRIPLRLAPGEDPQFSEQDIVLEDGDVVFIESREKEFFYTGGLLGGGQYTLPRDYDLDLLAALSIAQSQVNLNNTRATRAIGGNSALNRDVTIGASSAVIIRRLPQGGTVSIKVDLYEMARDPSKRLIIQPGDHIVLQYTPREAVSAWLERHVLEGMMLGLSSALLL